MNEGQPTNEQLYKIIGSIYSDAFLRIEFLEKENKQLREDQHKNVASLQSSLENMRKERDELKAEKAWNNGKGNSMLPELLLENFQSDSTS